MPKSNLLQRLPSAVVAAPIMLGLLYYGPPWGWLLLVMAAATIGSLELFAMTHPKDRVSAYIGTALVLGVIGVLWQFTNEPKILLVLIFALPFIALVLTMMRLGDIDTAAQRGLAMAFGPLYVGGGLATSALLCRDGGDDGPSFVLLAIMLSWLSDTGAYFAGRFLGKHKLFPAVSPKKTVEGALGGLAGAVAGALLASFFYLRSLPVLDGVLLALIGGGLGQVGDLGESMIKRSFNVKDSGGIVPGHGGILDRVDALMVTSIATYLYVLFVRMP